MTATPRLCRCGCGEALKGSTRKRFVDDGHRMRARRARSGEGADPNTDPNANANNVFGLDPDADTRTSDSDTPAPDATPGRCEEGLQRWLDELVGDLPPALVEHARMLAAEVDADPTNSPMHGRYSSALAALIEADRERRPVDPDTLDALWRIRATCSVPEHHRGAQVVHCSSCCWQRVRACVAGQHSPVYDGGMCEHCGSEATATG